jgi:uncharacterized protein YllA (UPF0747 family)
LSQFSFLYGGIWKLRFEELPEFPQHWLDFLNSKLLFSSAASEMSKLPERANAIHDRMARNETFRILADVIVNDLGQAHDSIQHLLQPGSVAVIARLQGSLFGGPIAQILKCLTAIRVCEELAKYGVAAVPVCWLDENAPSTLPVGSIQLLDKESELHCLQHKGSEITDFAPNDPLPRALIEELLLQIEDLGQGTFDMETIDLIRSAFVPEATLSSASANLLAALMKEWKLVVLNAAAPPVQSILTQARANVGGRIENFNTPFVIQSHVLPVIACVVDPHEIQAYERSLPLLDECDLPMPMAWPQASVTMLDARSCRVLERFNLSLDQLYSGEEEIAGRMRDAVPRSATEKLEILKSEVSMRMDEVRALDHPGSEFAKTADACEEKIIYQLQKLLDRCADARKRQEQVANRQIHKLCNFLAPNRRMQEKELGGIQIPLRYSLAGLRSLYGKLDIMKFEHQLISMD